MRRGAFFSLAAAAVLLLAGGAAPAAEGGKVSAADSGVAATATALTDQRGKTFAFPTPATRVIPIAIPLFWTYLITDGSAAHVVGANPVAMEQMHAGILERVFPHAGDVPVDVVRGGTFTPNLETVLALKPDAMIQWADRGDELIAALDRVGLRAVGVKNTSHEDDNDIWMRFAGIMSGHQDRAEAIIAWEQEANRRFEGLTASIPVSEQPKVVMFSTYSKSIVANGPTSYFEPTARRVGAVNAAAADGTVSIEEVLRWAPDVILLSQFEAKTPADMIADPLWQSVPAVRNRRVYKLPFGVTRWGSYGPESPLFMAWLTDLLYPGRFTLALRPEMKKAYATFFGYAAAESDLDRVLALAENGASAHYDAFHETPPQAGK